MAIQSDEQNSLDADKLFCNEKVQLLFWDDVRPYYISYDTKDAAQQTGSKGKLKTRAQFVREELITNGIVILCLEDHCFRLRSGANPDLCAFELFLEDLILAGNGLVAFARQVLLYGQKTTAAFVRKEDYRISFKLSKDFIKTSLEETMEPKPHLVRSVQFVEPMKPGCFDRLLQLLAMGQEFVTEVERQWGPPLESTSQKKKIF